ncbi:MAG: hypothetical protein AABW41_01950 [Nanoarchaeota archaeon]
MEKKVLYVFIFVLILGAVSAFNINLKTVRLAGNAILDINTCNDGTEFGKCSEKKEFFCESGNLISNCDLCGCGDGFACKENRCVFTDICEEGNGQCLNQCSDGYSELYQLTGTCNKAENENGTIDIANTKGLLINTYLKNSNQFRALENVYVNVFVENTEIKNGYTLLVLYPNQEHLETLKLVLPENIDKSNAYVLNTQVSYSDKTLNQKYEISSAGKGFSFIIKEVVFADNQKVRLGDDLIANFEIVNKKCCIKTQQKVDRFYGYCSYESLCANQKPLVCKRSILVEDCSTCGCPEDYNCNINGKCITKVSSEEIQKFYDLVNIEPSEQAIVGNFIRDYSRIPKSIEKPEVKIEDNKVRVQIENVRVEGLFIDNKPSININLNQE